MAWLHGLLVNSTYQSVQDKVMITTNVLNALVHLSPTMHTHYPQNQATHQKR